ncbi:hypothetical protein ARSEF4850_010146, partial [Beauveria asiatica]
MTAPESLPVLESEPEVTLASSWMENGVVCWQMRPLKCVATESLMQNTDNLTVANLP